jgi:hypothetical protein
LSTNTQEWIVVASKVAAALRARGGTYLVEGRPSVLMQQASGGNLFSQISRLLTNGKPIATIVQKNMNLSGVSGSLMTVL